MWAHFSLGCFVRPKGYVGGLEYRFVCGVLSVMIVIFGQDRVPHPANFFLGNVPCFIGGMAADSQWIGDVLVWTLRRDLFTLKIAIGDVVSRSSWQMDSFSSRLSTAAALSFVFWYFQNVHIRRLHSELSWYLSHHFVFIQVRKMFRRGRLGYPFHLGCSRLIPLSGIVPNYASAKTYGSHPLVAVDGLRTIWEGWKLSVRSGVDRARQIKIKPQSSAKTMPCKSIYGSLGESNSRPHPP